MKTGIIYLLFLTFILPFHLHLNAEEVVNQDKPAKGEFTFPLTKVWGVEEAGETLFSTIYSFVVSDSGNIFLRDLKNREFYAFNNNGEFITKFGLRGEGPSEVKNAGGANLHTISNKVIIKDSDKLLYFDDKGKFLRSIKYTGPVNLFLSENTIISAPNSIAGLSSDAAKMKHIDLKTGKEKIILDFTIYKSGVINEENFRSSATIPTITPIMVIGHHKGKFYHGVNNDYKISVTDINGKKSREFSLKRDRRSVSLKEREEVMLKLIKGYAPDEVAIRMAKTLPDKETSFSSVSNVRGSLFVTKSHFPARNIQQIDIFTPEGKYLYRAFVKIEDGYTITAGPEFYKDYIYLSQENEDGEIEVVKYKTTFPSL